MIVVGSTQGRERMIGMRRGSISALLIAVLLIVLLRYKPRGLVPEQLPRIPVPDVPGGRYQPTA